MKLYALESTYFMNLHINGRLWKVFRSITFWKNQSISECCQWPFLICLVFGPEAIHQPNFTILCYYDMWCIIQKRWQSNGTRSEGVEGPPSAVPRCLNYEVTNVMHISPHIKLDVKYRFMQILVQIKCLLFKAVQMRNGAKKW